MVNAVNIIYLKFAENNKCLHHPPHTKVTMWGNGCINWFYGGNHFTIYTYTKLCCKYKYNNI